MTEPNLIKDRDYRVIKEIPATGPLKIHVTRDQIKIFESYCRTKEGNYIDNFNILPFKDRTFILVREQINIRAAAKIDFTHKFEDFFFSKTIIFWGNAKHEFVSWLSVNYVFLHTDDMRRFFELPPISQYGIMMQFVYELYPSDKQVLTIKNIVSGFKDIFEGINLKLNK